jgi:hypothetical protein
MNLPTIGNQLNAAGSFASGANIAQNAIDSRLRRDQIQNQYDIQNRQVALQEQEYAIRMQQQLAEQALMQEAGNSPEKVLPQIYAINPKKAKELANFIQDNYQQKYQTANLLLNSKVEDKQFYYEGIKDQLQQQYPNIPFGDKFTAQEQKLLKREADIVKSKINTVYDLQETANGIENYNKMTGTLDGVIAPSRPNARGESPSAVREYEYFQSLNPKEKASYLNLKRNTVGEGMTFDEQGNVVPLDGYMPSKKDIESVKSAGKKEGELETERKFAAPKMYNSMQTAITKNDNVIKTIDNIIPNVSESTAGLGGVLLSKLPGTLAKDVERQIETVVANLGFKELQEMRNNSPTGGALGQVSERENELLQAIVANLKQDQSPKQLLENLKVAKEEIKASQQRIREAYDREYGTGNFKKDNLSNRYTPSQNSGQIKFLGIE